jgi:hypothetical protein
MVKKTPTWQRTIISTSHHQVDCWWGVIKAAVQASTQEAHPEIPPDMG